jgi:nitroreductase
MDYFEVIRTRHSIRNFQPRPVEKEKLRQILDAANAAPSAGNLQAYEIHVVTKVTQRSALARAANGQGFVLAAPVSLVFSADCARNQERYSARSGLYSIQDATIACTFAMLAAADLGLATVWTGAFDPKEVRRVVGAPEQATPVAILPIGYAAAGPEPRERRTIEDLVHFL